MINNDVLIENLRNCEEEKRLTVFSNGGKLTYKQIGQFTFLPLTSYYCPVLIANVLLLKAVDDMNGFHIIEMDTQVDPSIVVVKYGHELRFKHSHSGLFYYFL